MWCAFILISQVFASKFLEQKPQNSALSQSQFQTWVLTSNGVTWSSFGEAGQWNQYSSVLLTQISVSFDRTLWGVSSSGVINYYSTSGTWSTTDGSLKDISVGNDQRIWGVNSAGQVLTKPGVNGTWSNTGGGNFDMVTVDSTGTVWGVDPTRQLFMRDGVYGTWTQVTGLNVTWIAVDGQGVLWGLALDGQVWYRNGVSGVWVNTNDYRKFVSLSAAFDGSVWGIDDTRALWVRQGAFGGWIQFDTRGINGVPVMVAVPQ